MNKRLVLIAGSAASGKSTSLMNLADPEGVAYMCTEAGKDLPFKSKFKEYNITDPYHIETGILKLSDNDDIHTIVIDSLTYLLDMVETQIVLTSANKMNAWGEFQQYFKRLLQQHVANSPKNVIFTAHNFTELNENAQAFETKIPVKGALKTNGIESYFSCVIYTVKKTLKELEDYHNDLLTITPQDEMLGFKYCFQTCLTKDTVNSRIRSPMNMWDTKETFINNDTQLILNRLKEYYT